MSKTSVCISRANSKLGSIPSINLPPITTCRENCPCAKLCYACKGRFRFKNVKQSMLRNLTIYNTDPVLYENSIIKAAYNARFFRFHAAGDIPDTDYLAMMCRIARKCKGTKFLAFTKKYEMINGYIGAGNKIPRNLKIVFSYWFGLYCFNPYKFPVAYIRLKNGINQHEIPVYAHECSGNCAMCVGGRKSCWSLRAGQSVVFDEH